MTRRSRGRDELTIELSRDGQEVRARYHHAGKQLHIDARGPVPPSIDALATALLSGQPGEIDPFIGGARQWDTGADLFSLLFPEPGRIPAILTGLRLDAREQLPNYAFRLRIYTDVRPWAALPWSLTRYGETRLADQHSNWTFEVAGRREATGARVGYSRVPRVVVFAPAGGGLDPTSHIQRLHGRLCAANVAYEKESTFIRVDQLSALEKVCGGDGADLIYVFGHVEPGVPPRLARPGAPALSFAALADAISAAAPKVLYINGCHAGGARPGNAGGECAGRFDALIAPCSAIPADQAAKLAESWFEAHLIGGASPVEALYQAARDVDPGVGALPLAFTRYGEWDHDPVGVLRADVAVRLDRFRQRSEARGKVQELLDSRRRRVQVLVGAGERDNLIEELTGHLCQHLQATVREWVIVRCPIDLPPDRTGLEPEGDDWTDAERDNAVRGLAALARDAIAVGDDVPLPDAIGHAIRDIPRSRTALLWLDWGVYGDRRGLAHNERPALRDDCGSATFDAWLEFHLRLAAELDKRSVHVVASIGFEKATEVIADIEETTLDYAGRDPRFDAYFLPTLDVVKHHELLSFLHEDEAAAVPDGHHHAITGALMDATDGRYHTLVKAIAEGEHTRWKAWLSPPKPQRRRRW